ncbi:Abi family protein [Yersinia massiliensis]|uniref:Abi family protein n=1 Tax=Yersinia massiliensis TaxID=419257 RepID=UPI001CFC4937|nr:Abi family protein [Yersinia massiliensis]MCB5319945.1 Abi family protein [Yersinia massiliensis]
MTIRSIINSISQQRFSTYQTSIFNGASDEECLGIYLWNKQLASAFLPALQILEVSLRNSIYLSKIEYEEEQIEKNHSCNEWTTRKAAIDRNWFITAMSKVNNFESYKQINAARKKLINENKPLTPENYIAKLTLGFWVSMVDKTFDVNKATYLCLWPHLRDKVFPNAIDNRTGYPLSVNNIGTALRDINKIRNRLSHHEPLWRISTTYSVEQAINKVALDYKKCLTIIHWINPSNLKLLNIIENTDKVRELCNMHSIWKNKQLPNGIPTLPIIDTFGWCKPLLMNTRLEGIILNIDIQSGFSTIICPTEGREFLAENKSFSSGVAQFNTGDAVTFEPNSNTTGPQPVATSVRAL